MQLKGPNYTRVPMSNPGMPRGAYVSGGMVVRDSNILDQSGNPYRKPVDPIIDRTTIDVSTPFKDPINSLVETVWTIDAVRAALLEHCMGVFFRSGLLIDAMMGNDRIQAALGARTGALVGLPQRFKPSALDADKSVLKAWKKAWKLCHAPPGQGETLEEITRCRLMGGISVSELVWTTDNEDGLWQPYIKPWSLQFIYFDPSRRTLMACTEDGPIPVTPGDGRWFVTAASGATRSHILGLVRALALPWLLHGYARRDWARYSERHGMPIIKAKVPQMADAEDKTRFGSDLGTMGTEAVIVLPQGIDGEFFDIEYVEAVAQSYQGFDQLILRAENAITIAIQWQNLTTEVKEGSQAAARVHGDVKQTAVALDDRILADDVEQQIARPWAFYNYGDAALAPRVRRDTTILEDKLSNAQTLASFATAVQQLSTARAVFSLPKLAKAYGIRGLDAATITSAVQEGASPASAVARVMKGKKR